MPGLNPFWHLLETRPSRKAVTEQWRRVTGECYPIVKPLLSPTDEPATRYPDPERPGKWLRVVPHIDGTVVALDDDDWQRRFSLNRADIILHRLDLQALRKRLCDVLASVTIARTPPDAPSSLCQIGNWEPKKAVSFPVCLLLSQDASGLDRMILNLIAMRPKRGALLFTPTRANWTEAIDAKARSHRLMLIALAEVVDATPEGFAESSAWEEYLQAFCQMVGTTLPANYRNRAPLPRRASLMANVEKLKNALVEHIRSMRDCVVASIDSGDGARIVGMLNKSQIGRLAGLKPYQVTRCFDADPQLQRLYEMANDPEQVLRFGR